MTHHKFDPEKQVKKDGLEASSLVEKINEEVTKGARLMSDSNSERATDIGDVVHSDDFLAACQKVYDYRERLKEIAPYHPTIRRKEVIEMANHFSLFKD